jgi:hypothetical protein
MEYYNNILCVEGGWLYQEGEIMSKSNYDLLKFRGKLNVIRRGCLSTPALIAYDSIPDRFKAIIVEKYGDPYKNTPHDQFEILIKNDMAAFDFFSDHRKPDGSLLKPQKVAEYCANVNILNACHEIISKRNPRNKTLGGKTTGTWEKLSSIINGLDNKKYAHSLPPNYRALERKYKLFKSEGYLSLIHKNEGNSHSLKIDDDKKTAMFRELFGDHRNLDDAQILMLYNMVAEPMGWEKITVGTVHNWRQKLSVDTYAGRHGVTAHRNDIAMQVKRTAPTHPLYFWTMDGWDAELLFQKPTRDNKGRTVTTYHNRPTVVIVLDPCTKYPIGYAKGTHETPELIKAALRNAINHVKELFGARYKPHQLQTDNYAVSALRYMYESVAEKHTPARVKNAKAKVIEPYFNAINKKYCHLMKNWSGYGITSGKDKQPNDEYLNKIRHSFPDEQECYSQIDGIINMERASKREEYLAAWENMPKEDRLTLTDEMYLYLFGETTGYTNRLAGQGVLPTIGGRDYAFDSFDPNFRNYGYVDWMIKYDPADLSQVLAINAKKINNKAEEIGTLRFMLTQKYIQPMALKERKEGDAPQLAAVNTFNRELESKITERRALSSSTVNELFASNPQLNNTLSKLVLVDSRGQHKDTRNASRSVENTAPVEKKIPIAEANDYDEIIDDPLDFIRNNF